VYVRNGYVGAREVVEKKAGLANLNTLLCVYVFVCVCVCVCDTEVTQVVEKEAWWATMCIVHVL
jgi:hypothetical protein